MSTSPCQSAVLAGYSRRYPLALPGWWLQGMLAVLDLSPAWDYSGLPVLECSSHAVPVCRDISFLTFFAGITVPLM